MTDFSRHWRLLRALPCLCTLLICTNSLPKVLYYTSNYVFTLQKVYLYNKVRKWHESQIMDSYLPNVGKIQILVCPYNCSTPLSICYNKLITFITWKLRKIDSSLSRSPEKPLIYTIKWGKYTDHKWLIHDPPNVGKIQKP